MKNSFKLILITVASLLVLILHVASHAQDTTSQSTTTPSKFYTMASTSLEYVKSVSSTSRPAYFYGVKHGYGSGIEWVWWNKDFKDVTVDSGIGAIIRELPEVEVSANVAYNKPIDFKFLVIQDTGLGGYGSINVNGERDAGVKIQTSLEEIAGMKVGNIFEKIADSIKKVLTQ